MRQFRRELAEKERARGELAAREEILRLTSLRFAGRAWFDVTLRAKQNLQAGVEVDLARFDQEIKEVGGRTAEVGYRVEVPDPSVDHLAGQIFDALQNFSWVLRSRILKGDDRFADDQLLDTLAERISELRHALNAKILERVEELSRHAQPGTASPE
jgi:hypothetical protein